MIPGVNPRQLKQMMKQMGMSQEDIDAVEVRIKTKDKVYVFENPEVQKVVMQGNTSFQIVGSYTEEDLEVKVSISDDDVEVVSGQANVSKEEAKKALEDANGDIAQAIVSLSE